MSSRRPAKVRKKERDDSTDEDDDRPLYFCPGEGLDMEVVVSYVRGLVNKSAEIKVGVRKNVCATEVSMMRAVALTIIC